MALPTRPNSTKTYGARDVIYVPTMAAYLTAPTATEVNAAGSLRLTCYFFDSSAKPSQSTNLVQRNKRMCDTVVYQQVGDTSIAGGEVQYVINPQATAGAPELTAWTTLGGAAGGVTGFLVYRYGIANSVSPTAAQLVSVYPVEFGPGLIQEQGDGETAEAGVVQSFAVTGPIARLVALA
jgi:hypothetical protein